MRTYYALLLLLLASCGDVKNSSCGETPEAEVNYKLNLCELRRDSAIIEAAKLKNSLEHAQSSCYSFNYCKPASDSTRFSGCSELLNYLKSTDHKLSKEAWDYCKKWEEK